MAGETRCTSRVAAKVPGQQEFGFPPGQKKNSGGGKKSCDTEPSVCFQLQAGMEEDTFHFHFVLKENNIKKENKTCFVCVLEICFYFTVSPVCSLFCISDVSSST